jgi:Carboxypeptidase regulatory-like domain
MTVGQALLQKEIYMRVLQAFRNVWAMTGLTLLSAVFMWAQTPSRILGTIQSDKGLPVASAFVTVTSQPTLGGNPGTFSASTKTAGDGTFVFGSIPEGNYQICVQVVQSQLLNPCRWAAPPTIAVVAGQTASIGTVQLKTGYAVSTQIIDDSGDLAKNEGKTVGATILIGVWSKDGLFQSGRLKGKDSAAYYYELIVPYDTSLQFSLKSNFYKLSDSSGAEVDQTKGAQVAIQIPSGTNIPPVVYHVTGVQP